MSYVENNLMNGEKIIHKANIPWIILVPGITIFSLGLVLIELGDGWQILGIGLFVWGTASIIHAFIAKVSTELAVTSKRVIAKFGLIRLNTMELNHSQVESFSVDQSIVGRLLGFGTCIINGTGGGKTTIPNIDAAA